MRRRGSVRVRRSSGPSAFIPLPAASSRRNWSDISWRMIRRLLRLRRSLRRSGSRSGGDLKEVARAVVGLSEAWDPQHRKIRTPQDWLTAVLRAFDAREAPRGLSAMAGQLRHRLWAPPSPKGFSDTVRGWADPDSLMNCAELARTIARRVGRRVDPAGLVELIEVAAGDPLLALVADESIAAPERVALALAGPAFQWR